MRAVIDTNVLVSGLLWRGSPHALIEHIRAGVVTLITSPALLSELELVLRRPKFSDILARSRTDPEAMLGKVHELAESIDAPDLPAPVSRDVDDDAVLALAAASQPDLIVTGDADLLTLGTYRAILIVDPAEALRRIARSKTE